MPEPTIAPSESIAASTTQESHHDRAAHSVETDGPYFNPNYLGDELPPGPVVSGFSSVGKAIGGFFVALVEIPVGAAKWLGGDRPVNAAQMMEDDTSPDNRREGINKLLEYDFTKRDPYTTRYRQIAQTEREDITVKAVAIRASNRSRDVKATPVFVNGLEPPRQPPTGEASLLDGWVRLEAAKALVNVPDNAAAPGLVRLLMNPEENRDVRIAAADALKHYRTLTVARALVKVLNDREFGVSWQARQSLKYLFGRDLGYNDGAWLEYLSGPQSPVK
ncbi:MAG TPA: HEAT repeat domain-containing protein [Humisphaera sp.]|jgi:hypothetical protein|nr:HEAT repeat domain-containing protein [Humisphaera sp.]